MHMVGIVGGEVTGTALDDSLERSRSDEGTDTWCHEYGPIGLGIEYYTVDEQGATTWTDGKRSGVIHGAVTNRHELGWSVEDIFGNLFANPSETAAALEGSFAIACQDPGTDRQLIVTDKLGARPIFYTAEDPVRYASSVSTLVPFVDSPTLDLQAVSDMLLMGRLWGDHTLVEEIRAQRPATVLELDGDELTTTRYWKPDYTEEPAGDRYLAELVDRYRQAVRRTCTTLPTETGLWLSGGLDSRSTAGALHQYRQPGGFEKLTTYTYDANPPTNDNPKIASEVARTLGIENHLVPLTAETVGKNFERIIESTDGMLIWAFGANLAATYEMDSPPPVLLEGMQGALHGDHLYRHHLHGYPSAVESQLSSEGIVGTEEVSNLLTEPVDPLGTLKHEATRSEESTVRGRVLDIHFQNYFSRGFMASNRVMRDRVGTRVAQVDGEYLEWCAKLPRQYRKGSFRMRGLPEPGVPYEPTRAKLGVIRRINPDLANITYERSKIKPSWPYPAHVLGFVGNVLVNRLRSQPTYGSGQLADFWIRDTETRLHDHVTRLVDDACSRPLFDADAVRAVYDDQMAGANNASRLAQITTIEHWLQQHLD